MNYKFLLERQEILDRHIIERNELQDQFLLEDKILALKVEIGELANETRCFKFWSKKPASKKAVILEEFVDGIHFLLSISFDVKERLAFPNSTISPVLVSESKTDQFNEVYAAIERFGKLAFCSAVSLENEYTDIWSLYLGLGRMLGFTEEEIEEYYMYKNKVNHYRQDIGY